MSQRVWKMFSDKITFTPLPQFCVARKIMSGVQSNQGVHGYHGQMRSRSSSGTFGTTVGSFSRSEGITLGSIFPPSGSALIGASVPTATGVRTIGVGPTGTGITGVGTGCEKPAKSSVGTGFGLGTFSAGFSFKIGSIFSTSSGSRRHSRRRHHHHGSQPQHQRNLIVKCPAGSVTAVLPTCELESHHQKKSTS